MSKLTRRLFMSAIPSAIAIPAAAADEASSPPRSIDRFLASASTDERAWYHATALAKMMSDMHPTHRFRCHISQDTCFALVVGDKIEVAT